MKYKTKAILNQFSIPFINATVQQMYKYESSLLVEPLLSSDEMIDFYLMQLGAMPSEIGVEFIR